MAITSEIIGKLGGRVESVPVEGRQITASNTVIHTVEVPPGKSLLVGFVCRFTSISSLSTSWPVVKVGNVAAVGGSTSTDFGISAIITETSNLTISAGSGVNSATISGGTVYTTEI